MLNQKQTEHEMVLDCYNYLIRKNDYKKIVLEVPFLSRCIDMVIITNENKILTIEYKLKNVKQAIRQAQDHALGADHAFICIPENQKFNAELLVENNIGLFVYNQKSKTKLTCIYYPENGRRVELFNKQLFETTEYFSKLQKS